MSLRGAHRDRKLACPHFRSASTMQSTQVVLHWHHQRVLPEDCDNTQRFDLRRASMSRSRLVTCLRSSRAMPGRTASWAKARECSLATLKLPFAPAVQENVFEESAARPGSRHRLGAAQEDGEGAGLALWVGSRAPEKEPKATQHEALMSAPPQ
jgi:hypothetical protein